MIDATSKQWVVARTLELTAARDDFETALKAAEYRSNRNESRRRLRHDETLGYMNAYDHRKLSGFAGQIDIADVKGGAQFDTAPKKKYPRF